MTDGSVQIDSSTSMAMTTAVRTGTKAFGSGQAGAQGSWELLPFHSEVLAVHAVLPPTGKVLFAAGSGNSAVRFADANFGNTALKFWTSVVWDPTVSPPPGQDTDFFHPATHRTKVLDLFCGGETPRRQHR